MFKKILKHTILGVICIIVLLAIIVLIRLLIISVDFKNNQPTHEMYFQGKIYGNYIEILEVGGYWVDYYDHKGIRTRDEKVEINALNSFYIEFEDGEVYASVKVTPNAEGDSETGLWKLFRLSPVVVDINEVKSQKVKYILNVYSSEDYGDLEL